MVRQGPAHLANPTATIGTEWPTTGLVQAGDLKKRAVFFGDSNLAMASGGLLGLQNTTTTDYSVNAEVGSGLEDWLLNIAYQPSPPDAAVIALGGNNVLSDGVWGSDDQDALHRAIELSSATMRCTVLVPPQPAMLKDGVPLLPEVNKALWAEAVFTNQRNAALDRGELYASCVHLELADLV